MNHRLQVTNEDHFCKRSLDLEVQVRTLKEKLDRNQNILKVKANEIKRLKALVLYYQKRTHSLKEIISDLKSQKMISDQAEKALNVRIYR